MDQFDVGTNSSGHFSPTMYGVHPETGHHTALPAKAPYGSLTAFLTCALATELIAFCNDFASVTLKTFHQLVSICKELDHAVGALACQPLSHCLAFSTSKYLILISSAICISFVWFICNLFPHSKSIALF